MQILDKNYPHLLLPASGYIIAILAIIYSLISSPFSQIQIIVSGISLFLALIMIKGIVKRQPWIYRLNLFFLLLIIIKALADGLFPIDLNLVLDVTPVIFVLPFFREFHGVNYIHHGFRYSRRIFVTTFVVMSLLCSILFIRYLIIKNESVLTKNKTYSTDNFSLQYSSNLYPVKTQGGVEFYQSQEKAEQSQICIENNFGTFDKPCGFGAFIFQIRLREQNLNLSQIDNYHDIHGREWKIFQTLPETGSPFGMLGYIAEPTNANKDLHVEFSYPSYVADTINLTTFRDILNNISIN